MTFMIQRILQERIYLLSVLLLVVVVITSIIFPDTFPTFGNFRQILLNASIDTIVAVGMMLLLISGTFDLSVGSLVALSACMTGYLMQVLQIPI